MILVFFLSLNALFLNLLHFLLSRQLFEMLVNKVSMHDIQNFKIHVLEWQFSLILNYFAVLISFLHVEDPNLKWNSSCGVNSTRTELSWKLFLYYFFSGFHAVTTWWTIYKHCKTQLVKICTEAKSCKGMVCTSTYYLKENE